jgi:hypothetical protein
MGYEEFSVPSVLEGGHYRCRFEKLMTGISLRHSDSVDVQFLVNGKRLVVALPHAAFAEYRNRTGHPLTDADAIQIAGRHLKEVLERGGRLQDRFLTPSVQETIEVAQEINLPASR